jgi:hypothetical protein
VTALRVRGEEQVRAQRNGNVNQATLIARLDRIASDLEKALA